MRIHIHNGRAVPLTPAVWDAAVSRAPDVGDGHEVSFGDTIGQLAAALPTTELLVCVGHGDFRPLPAAAPCLRMVFVTFAGIDSLLPLDWLPSGVSLLNNAGTHSAKAGEFAIMSVLLLASHVPVFIADQHARRWERRLGTVLAGRRLVVVGLGSIGGESARRAKQFDMHVTGIRARPAPHPDCDQVHGTDMLESALAKAEFLLLACPLTTATRHILDARRIALLPTGAGVINVGRGGLIEQDALCDALDAGHLGGAVLDVSTPEPVPPEHRLWSTTNLVLTPHVSSDDRDAYLPRSLDVLMTNLRALRDGRTLPNQVDGFRGY